MTEIERNKNKPIFVNGDSERIDSISPSVLTELFDSLSEAVVVADRDRRMVYANSAAEKLFGYSGNELVGNETKMLYACERDFFEQGERRYHPDSAITSENYRVAYRRSDGEDFLGFTTGAAMRSAEGSIVGYIGIIRPARSSEQSLDTLQKIHAVSSDSSKTDSQKIESLLKIGLDHFGLELAIQSRIDENDYVVEHCVDLNGELQPGTRFDLSGTYCVHALGAGRPVGFHFAGESEIQTHPCYRDFKLESYIGGPIKIKGETYGTVNFSRAAPTEPFCQDDYILIELLAETLSYIIYKKQSEEELIALARTDALTGLPNRRATLERLTEHMKLSKRSGSRLTILLIDLDHFKEINDRWGHSAGDAALVGFARIVSDLGRETDFCGRVGGEEFIFILPDADARAGLSIGNKLRQRLADDAVDLGNGETINLGLSAGIATWETDESLESLLSRADRAMYEAKNAGRDQVCLSQPGENE